MTIPLISFTVTDPKSGITKEINHIREVKRTLSINETISLSFRTVDRPTNLGYSLVEAENIISYEGHEYRIKQVNKLPHYKYVVCTHIFSDLVGVQRHENLFGNTTLIQSLAHIFDGTGWNFQVDPELGNSSITLGEDQWGKGNAIKLLEDVCNNIFKVEFELLPNRVIKFVSRLSSDKGNKYEYGVNIKTIAEKFDSTSLRTQIRGTYEVIDGQDEDGNDIKEERTVVYTSPASSIYGIIEAEPISDNDVKNDSEMYSLLQEKLNDEVQYSLDISAIDLNSKELGETVTINYKSMGIINSKSRILKLEETFMLVDNEWKLVPEVITLGNYIFGSFRSKVKDKINELEEEIEKLKKRLPGVFWLSSFKIGDVNSLALPGVLLPTKAELPGDITAEVLFEEYESLTGLFATLKSNYKDYHITVTEYTNEGTTSYDYKTVTETLNTKKYPFEGLKAISIVITDVPLDEFDEKKNVKQVLGVKFAKGEPENKYLSQFTLGDTDCLTLDGLALTSLESTPAATIEYTELNILQLTLALKEEYKDYHLSVRLIREGTDDVTIPYEEGQTYPSGEENTGLMVIVSDVPYDELIVKPVGHDYAVYGVNFIKVQQSDGYHIEVGTCQLANEMTYYFENEDGYDEVLSIVTGIIGDVALSGPINLVAKAIETDGKFKSVKILANWGTGGVPNVEVSIQAICKKVIIGGESSV